LRVCFACLVAVTASGHDGTQAVCEAARAHIPGTFADCRVLLDADVRGQRNSLVVLWNAASDPLGRRAEPGFGTRIQFAVVTVPPGTAAGAHVVPAELPEDSFIHAGAGTGGLRVLATSESGVLFSAALEQWQHPLHWWFSWPVAGKGLPRFQRWKAYRFDRVLPHGGRTYYVGINGSRRVVIYLEKDGAFAIAPIVATTAVLAQFPTERHTFGAPPGQKVAIPFEDWHPRSYESVARVTASGGAVCEANGTYGAKFETAPGKLYRRVGGKTREYTVRQFTVDEYMQRRRDAGDPLMNKFEREQLVAALGPLRAEGSRLWFGRAFYDAEGLTGIGGFGYLDCETGDLQEYFPVETARFMTSAMLVEPDAVWLSLSSFGEYGSSPGGLLTWSRAGGSTRLVREAPLAFDIVRDGSYLVLPHDAGISTLMGDDLRHYAIREMADGSLDVMAVHTP
ncbi:MAG: hypothetical protein KIT83_07310, partial [Bryobacterales bacterium]|nr:hypothetical protein [Bryobacterales bacterium]